MLKFPLISNLNNTNIYNLLIVENQVGNDKYKLLVDTGASIPVWVDGEEVFSYFYPDAILSEKKAYLGGFGGSGEIVDVYTVPEFIICDGKDKISFSNMPIAVTNRDFSFQMIASFTMFNKMSFNYDVYDENTIAHIPVLRLKPNRNAYRSILLCSTIIDRNGNEREMINGLDVYAQD